MAPRATRARADPGRPMRADWLPPRDAAMEMRYRDATRMGKIYLMPDGVARPVAGWDEQRPGRGRSGADARCLALAHCPATTGS